MITYKPVEIIFRGVRFFVTPSWVLQRLRRGLTPEDCTSIALAAWPRPAEWLIQLAQELEP